MLSLIGLPAGTQTLMTFPVNFDLHQLLGPGFSYTEDKSGCDLGNSSLRRKLFGQPDRQVRLMRSVILHTMTYTRAHTHTHTHTHTHARMHTYTYHTGLLIPVVQSLQ